MDAHAQSGKKSPTNSEGSGGSGKKDFVLFLRDKGDLKVQFFLNGSKNFYIIPQADLKKLVVKHMAQKMLTDMDVSD